MNKEDFYSRPYSERTGCGGPLLLAIACLSCLCLWIGSQFFGGDGEVVRSDTVTVVRVDTVFHTDTVPKVVKEEVVSYVKVPVPSSSNTGKNGESAPDSITLPVVQREYSDDSTYTAWVSGVAVDSVYPKLDSISVRERIFNVETVITNTVRKKQSRWSFSVTAGPGFDVTNREFGMMIVAGVSYRIN
jgi:hypothetical protein